MPKCVEKSRWIKLPEWSRWILCWPVILLLNSAIFLIAKFIMWSWLNMIHAGEFIRVTLNSIFLPSVTISTGFFFIHIFVPRKPTIFTGFIVFSWSSFGVFEIISFFIDFHSGNIAFPFASIIKNITSIVVSWVSFIHFKNNHSKDCEFLGLNSLE